MFAMVGVALWAVAPLIVAGVAVSAIFRTEMFPTSSVWIGPDPGTGTIDRPVGLQLRWSEPTEVYAPSWLGLVQAVYVEPGETIPSGGVVAKVDGIDRIAYAGNIPFARPLESGDRGEDVRSLNALLRERGLSTRDSDEYTWATARGVAELAKVIGVESSERSRFDPAWIVYLPEPSVVVDTVSLEVGAPAPSAGTVIVSSSRSLVSAGLIDSSNIPPASSETATEAADAVPGITAAQDETLVVGTEELNLDESLQFVDRESVSRVAGLVQPLAAFTRGVLRRPVPPDHFRIPVGAVIMEKNGEMCVLKATTRHRDGEVTGYQPVAVSVTSSGDGAAWVTGDLTAEDLVSASPAVTERSCARSP